MCLFYGPPVLWLTDIVVLCYAGLFSVSFPFFSTPLWHLRFLVVFTAVFFRSSFPFVSTCRGAVGVLLSEEGIVVHVLAVDFWTFLKRSVSSTAVIDQDVLTGRVGAGLDGLFALAFERLEVRPRLSRHGDQLPGQILGMPGAMTTAHSATARKH